MTIATGDHIPEVKLSIMTADGPKVVTSTEALGSGKVVLFAVPGAFTPGCSDHHLPGYLLRGDELRAKGVDTIACVSVNDAFVMGAWGEAKEVGDQIVMLADGSGEFAAAVGLQWDASKRGLGVRSQRYAAILEDGVVTGLFLENGPGIEHSTADKVLAAL